MKIRQYKKTILILPLLGFWLFTTNANAQHKKYTAKDMPSAVIETFNKMYPKASAIGYDIEKENGTKFYEIESKEGDIRRDLQFNEDGSISEIEEQINISDLPDKVVSAIGANYPKGTIAKAEKVTKGTDILYEVVVKIGKKKHEVRLNTNGDIINEDND